MDESSVENQLVLCRLLLKLGLKDNTKVTTGKPGNQHDVEYGIGQVLQLSQATVSRGESNSALVLSPACILLNAVVTELSRFARSQPDCILINLNGLLHTDDKLALKAIAEQMSLDKETEGKVFGSFAENLSFLLQCLKAGKDKSCKSVIFILEEFDLFCHSRGSQTLLYNLFDVAQSKQAPICVIGFTSRLDVMEMLEKRVKSRFSHRQIFLFSTSSSSEEGFEQRMDLFRKILYLPTQPDEECHEDILDIYKNTLDSLGDLDPVFVMFWNNSIKNLSEDESVRQILKTQFELNSDEQSLRDILMHLICQISPEHPEILPEDVISACKKQSVDDKTLLLLSLSVLELCLIIAMKHQAEIYDNQPMNFEMILTRYMKFANSNSSTQAVPRIAIQKAFEHIQSLELIGPAKGDGLTLSGNSRIQKEYQLYKLLIMPSQIIQAVKSYKALPTEVSQWAFSMLI